MFPRIHSVVPVAVAAGLLLSSAPVVAEGATFAFTPMASVVRAASSGVAVPAAQWAVSPADANGPDGRVSLRHTVDPGASVSDAIAVTNLGPAPATYVVAPGDGVLGDNGAFDVAVGEPRGSGAWIAVDGLQAGNATVAPGETRVLPVRIDVPADVTPGDHPAGIVVGITRADDGVTVSNRIGVRVHLRVAGDIVPALQASDAVTSFTPSWVPFAPGRLRVETTVVNAGNVRLGALGGITGVGVDATAPSGDPVELLPGDTGTIITETTAWPVVALFGASSVRPVVLGDDVVTAPPVAEVGFSTLAPSWTGLVLLGLIAGAAVWLVSRRRARRKAESGDEGHAPALNESPAALR